MDRFISTIGWLVQLLGFRQKPNYLTHENNWRIPKSDQLVEITNSTIPLPKNREKERKGRVLIIQKIKLRLALANGEVAQVGPEDIIYVHCPRGQKCLWKSEGEFCDCGLPINRNSFNSE